MSLKYKEISLESNTIFNLDDLISDFHNSSYHKIEFEQDNGNFQIEEENPSLNEIHNKISQYFYDLSIAWEKMDITNLQNFIESYDFKVYDESFNRFGLASIAVKTFKTSDDPVLIIELLKFLRRLIYSSSEYINDLKQADFLVAIYSVYKDIKSCDCIIETLKCASIIAQTNHENRNDVYSIFQVPININEVHVNLEVLNQITQLLVSYMMFPINSEMYKKISAFLLKTLDPSKPIFQLDKKHSIFEEDFYQTLSLCFVKLIQFHFDDCMEFFMQNPILDILKFFLQSSNSDIAKRSIFIFGSIYQNAHIQDLELEALMIKQIYNNNEKLIFVSCDSLAIMINQLQADIPVELRGPIISKLLELIHNQSYNNKIAIFHTISIFFFTFPEYIPFCLKEDDLIEYIYDMLEMENFNSIEAIILIDSIFVNISKEKDIDVKELDIYQRFKEENGFELVSHLLDGDEKVVEYAKWFLSTYDSTIEFF